MPVRKQNVAAASPQLPQLLPAAQGTKACLSSRAAVTGQLLLLRSHEAANAVCARIAAATAPLQVHCATPLLLLSLPQRLLEAQ